MLTNFNACKIKTKYETPLPLDLITCTEGHYHIYMYLCDKWAMSHVYKQYIK